MNEINFVGAWDVQDREAAIDGIDKILVALGLIGSTDPRKDLLRLVGNLTLEAARKTGLYFGYVSASYPDRIQLRIGHVTPYLLIHEFGHIINDNVMDSESPSYLLGTRGVVTPTGKLVTGPGLGGYKRHAGRYAPHNGYLRDTYPYMQHPRNWVRGNDRLEDWCDMFLAWATNNFADNEQGRALRSWIVSYLMGRLA